MTLKNRGMGEELLVFASQTPRAPTVERRPPLRLPHHPLIPWKQVSILDGPSLTCVVV
jgi:hypothetical protein